MTSGSASLVHLRTDAVSVVIDMSTGVPTLLHWGARLGDNLGDLRRIGERPIPHGGLDVVAPLSLVPEHGSGFVGRPGLEGSRSNGSGWSPRFAVMSHTAGSHDLTAVARDDRAGLELVTEIALDPVSSVLRMRATVHNIAADSYQLGALLLTAPLPGEAQDVVTFGGRWCNEFVLDRQQLVNGMVVVENRTGRTSHSRVPAVFAGSCGFNETTGEVWALHVGWSGNATVVVEAMVDGRRRLYGGELLLPGEISLAPDATYETPWLYGAYSAAGANSVSQCFHRYLRGRSQHPHTSRPASLNTWEAVYFNHNLATLTALADRAAEIGLERYVLDDGWFHGRRSDHAGLGDWWVDASVWPKGLTPLIEHVRKRGLEFGIWVEPEMVNPDSNLYRAHPEWVLVEPGYEPVFGRHQLVLDLGRAEVREYLFSHLDALLSNHDIAYVKWDMNREIVHGSHDGQAGVHRQTLGLYELLDRLRAAHPRVEFESCASGGGRIDFAILDRTARVWTSDCNDPLERQRIQRGYSYLFPPELMGAHVGPPMSHTTRRTQSLAFRCGTALFGHFGIEWNLLDTTEAQRAELAVVVALYKQFRGLFHAGDWLRIDTPDDATLAHAVIAPDRSEAVVSFAQMVTARALTMARLRIPGLAAERNYRIRVLPLPAAHNAARRQPAWVSEYADASGRELAGVGVQPPLLDPESLVLLHIRAIDSVDSVDPVRTKDIR
jgi:alpha-galactosidase